MVDPVRVLHVDDDPAVADLTATVLDREDGEFDVVSTTSPTEAVELLDDEFDCVVSDFRMPEVDGLELLETVREEYPNLPFIIFTGCGSEEVASDAVSAGVTDYVPKGPGTTRHEVLADRIRAAVGRRRVRDGGSGPIVDGGIDGAFLEQAVGAYAVVGSADGTATVEECSGEFADLLGYASSDVVGEPLASFVADDETFDPAAADGEWESCTFETADGDAAPVRYRSAPGVVENRTVITFVDDSEREELAEEVEWFEDLVNTVPDAIYALDDDMHYLFVNEGMADLTGYSREEIIGAHKSLVNTDESVESGRIKRQDFMKSGHNDMKVGFHPHITAEGEEIPTEVRFRPLPTEDDEEFKGTAGVIRDVSGRLERERELERQNRRLDEFASVVSHDLRNPLNVVEGRVELARMDCECGGAEEHLAEAQAELNRMNDLIEDVLSFARHGEEVTDYETVGLRGVTESAWESVESEEPDLVVEDDLAMRANRLRVQRLFENLMRNAVEHGGEDVTVRIGALPADDDGYTGFYLADDGPGIPPDRRDEAFELGMTTASDGTGFGLAIVKTIVETHGWSVDLTESESGGARFEISEVECDTDPDALE